MKIICVGRNYAEHAKELNNAVPTEPVLFMKGDNALLTPGAPVSYPEFTQKLQYECEVVLKISREGKNISKEAAGDYFREISLGIDFTARDLQERLKEKRLPWEISKSFDGSAATGTFIPVESVTDPQNFRFELMQNGATVQRGNVADMIFSFADIIAYASKFFTLAPGDLLFTGTPAGVGDVARGDQLQGSLEGRQLLQVTVQ